MAVPIDRIFVNFSRSIAETGTLAALVTDDVGDSPVRSSDHRVAHCVVNLERKKTFKWLTYTYRQYTKQAEEKFKKWLVMHEWREVLAAAGSNEKANAYQNTLDWAINEFFPLRTTRKRSTDLPVAGKGGEKARRKP